MNRTLPLLLVASFAVPAHAAQNLEAARAAAAASFHALPGFNSLPKGTPPAPVRGTPAAPTPLRSPQYVRISGNINLNGSGYVSRGSNYVNVTLNGWTDVSDYTGRIRTGNTYVTTTAFMFVHGNWVSDWVRPSLYVSLYQDGRYLGQARVDGNIHVSGFVNGGWVSVSGSGTLSGDVWLRDP